MTVATRAPAAKPEETTGLLEELFKALYPRPDRSDEPEWQGPGTLREPLYHHWFTRINRFQKMIAAEAFIDAAMMLVPEDRALDCLKEGEIGSWYVNLRPRDWVSEWGYGKGETPALALIAAIAASKEFEMNVNLSDDNMKDIIAKAVLDTLTPESRNDLIQNSIKSLLTTKPSGGYGSVSPLQSAFNEAIATVARQVASEQLKANAEVKTALEKLITDAWGKLTHDDGYSLLVEKVVAAMTSALAPDRY